MSGGGCREICHVDGRVVVLTGVLVLMCWRMQWLYWLDVWSGVLTAVLTVVLTAVLTVF